MENEEKKMIPLQAPVVNTERRKHPRFPVHLRIQYCLFTGSRSHFGQVLDISRSGLLLHLSEAVEVGQNLRLKIFVGSGTSKFIEALVRVVWRKSEKGAGYRIGVRFVHLSSEEMKKLRILLDQITKPRPSKVLVAPLAPVSS